MPAQRKRHNFMTVRDDGGYPVAFDLDRVTTVKYAPPVFGVPYDNEPRLMVGLPNAQVAVRSEDIPRVLDALGVDAEDLAVPEEYERMAATVERYLEEEDSA
jgi:hypothetical protein